MMDRACWTSRGTIRSVLIFLLGLSSTCRVLWVFDRHFILLLLFIWTIGGLEHQLDMHKPNKIPVSSFFFFLDFSVLLATLDGWIPLRAVGRCFFSLLST